MIDWQALVMGLLVAMGGYGLRLLTESARQTKDLWHWHKPDDSGRQTWKDLTPMMERLDRVIALLEAWLERNPDAK